MQLQLADYNGADALCAGAFATEWREIETALAAMPLHVQGSDQAGKQGTFIFDPKGTNSHIKDALGALGWGIGTRIPAKWKSFGKGVDFTKRGMLVEVQYSNYPFLLNNVIRSEMFAKVGVEIGGSVPEILVVITKAHMFDASNSTLYFEQGSGQLAVLERERLFSFPVRLVGLAAARGDTTATYTKYSNARYSRTTAERVTIDCCIADGLRSGSRATVRRR
jgi:hypothetical protein